MSSRGFSRSDPEKRLVALDCFALLAMTVATLSFASGQVQAESVNSDLNLSINSVVALSITNCDNSSADTITINIDPTNAGVFKSTCQNINVGANTPGYSLLIKSSSTDLIYQNPTAITPAPVVPSTTAGTIGAPSMLPDNTWGFAIEKQVGMDGSIGFDANYTIDNQNNRYALLPTTDRTIYQTNQLPAPLNAFRAFYGAKLTLATLAGEYKTTITYTAIGETVPCAWNPAISFEDPDCIAPDPPPIMQDFTSVECATMQVYTNNNDDDKLMALTDIRDGQVYLVGKLADGNCWMLNNLKLGSLVNDITLTPADTNVTTDWVLPRIDNTNVNPYYDAPRLYAFVAGQSNFSTTKPNSEEVNIDSKDFAGYYYNWCAATAGTLSTTCTPQIVMPTDAVQDICPAGWRIPKGGNAGDTSNEFDQLSAKMAGYTDNQGQYEDDFDYFDPTFIENFLFEGPFRGVLAGSGGSWVNLGLYGYIWSMSYTTYSAQNAFGLSFAESSIIPVWRGGGRGASLSVRCLLKP